MNQTPQLDNRKNSSHEPLVAPQTEYQKAEKNLSDRILAYAFAASVLINIGCMIWVSHSDLFGKGSVIPPMKETQIKVFKRPLPPKPKKQVKPPPPPPKQQPPPKQPAKPLPHIVHPHPTPHIVHPHPTPQPHMAHVAVAMTHSQVANNSASVQSTAPSTEQGKPAYQTDDTTSSPQSNVTTPPTSETEAPPVKAAPPVQAAPVVQAPPSKPKLADREIPELIGSFEDYQLGVDATQANVTSVTVSWSMDEHGRAIESSITFPPTGNSDVDDAILAMVRKFRFRPRVVNGKAEGAPFVHTFQLTD